MEVEIDRIRRHIELIASAPRPAESPELERTRQYVSKCLEDAGWSVERQEFSAGLDDHGVLTLTDGAAELRGVNLVAKHSADRAQSGPRFCLGAHLDSRPDSAGADDNASAVATVLEIARLFPLAWPESPRLELEVVVFDLEENGMLGGAFHARQSRTRNVDLRGMVSLEMLGYCDHTPGSQSLPRSLVGLYPDTGNFIAIIGNQNSAALIEAFRDGMRRVDGLPVETLAVPSNGEYLQATRLSDHSPFWDAGYAALMITDTSFLRNPYYHTPGDTLETLDMDFLHAVAQGCYEAVCHTISAGL